MIKLKKQHICGKYSIMQEEEVSFPLLTHVTVKKKRKKLNNGDSYCDTLIVKTAQFQTHIKVITVTTQRVYNENWQQ